MKLKSSKLVWARRLSQTAFLVLFAYFLLHTEFGNPIRSAGPDVRLRYPVQLFFQLDPLVALANLLASHSFYRGLEWSLLVLIPTLLFGRFFCGWVCPMGTLHHIFGALRPEWKRGKRLIESNRYKRWQTIKYYLLASLLIAATFGSGLVGWFDPFSLLVRSVGLSIFPASHYASSAVIRSLESSSWTVLQLLGDLLHRVLSDTVLSLKQPHFRQGVFLGSILVVLLALNLRVTRFWCRALCPLGALLGVASRWSLLGLKKDLATCNDCNRCAQHCQGGDDPVSSAKWRKAECHLCMNCVDACPSSSLRFEFGRDKSTTIYSPDLKRRWALTGVVAGLAAVPLLRSTNGLAVENDHNLLRPPGALEESDFLARCIRCGECMKVCPNNALHPSFTEAGLEGLWSPVLVPRVGYCAPNCTLCSSVCPTGAIAKIQTADKGWGQHSAGDKPPIRLGTAFFDRGRCVVWATGVECGACEKACPTEPRAIYLREAEVADSSGNVHSVKQPWADTSRCVGCGACEYACPLHERPAVYVTSIGESRSPNNRIFVNGRDLTSAS